jgi:RNase P/RNase MRP subunit p30
LKRDTLTGHYDLYVQVSDTKRWATLPEYILAARRLNLTGLGITAAYPDFSSELNRFTFKNAGICLLSRLTIKHQKLPQIKQILARNYQKVLLIAVETSDVNICKWAAHDRRVDLITIDPTQLEMDKGLANLLKIHQKPVELMFSPLFRVVGPQRSRLLRNYYKTLNQLLGKKITLCVSSGATSVFDLRSKQEIIAISTQLGISKTVAHAAVSEGPMKIIQERLEQVTQVSDPNQLIQEDRG